MKMHDTGLLRLWHYNCCGYNGNEFAKQWQHTVIVIAIVITFCTVWVHYVECGCTCKLAYHRNYACISGNLCEQWACWYFLLTLTYSLFSEIIRSGSVCLVERVVGNCFLCLLTGIVYCCLKQIFPADSTFAVMTVNEIKLLYPYLEVPPVLSMDSTVLVPVTGNDF